MSEGRVPERWQTAIEEADRYYRRAFLLDPLVDLETIGAVIPPRSAGLDEESRQAALEEAVGGLLDDLLEGRYERAHDELERLMEALGSEEDPGAIPDWLLWYSAQTAARAEKYEDAIRHLNRLRARSNANERHEGRLRVPLHAADFRYLAATLEYRAGLLQDPVRAYEEVLEHDPDFYMAYVQIARIHESRSDWLEAAEACRKALTVNPDDPSLLYDLGVMLGRANRLGEAEGSLLKAQTLNPRDARISYVLGLVRISRGNPDGAREALEHFVSIAPRRYGRMIADAEKRLELLR
jgi:tetratricopeptide (TPR) repeat protein